MHGFIGGGEQGNFPFYAYHGYWALDFTKIDPNYGDEESLKTLVDEAHKRGMRIILDVVMNHAGYATLAQQPVHTLEELGRVKGVGQEGAQRRGNEILAAIAKGEAIPERDLPRVERPARRIPDPAFESRVEALKHRRNRLAEELQLAPGVLCPNGTLEAIARAEPASLDALATIPELRRWQVKVLGPSLLQAVAASG